MKPSRQMKSAARLYAVQALFQMEQSDTPADRVMREFEDHRFGATLEEGDSAHLVLVPTPPYKPKGDFDLVAGRVHDTPEPKLTFSGVAVYRPQFFSNCSPGRFPLVFSCRQRVRPGASTGPSWARD